MSPLHITLYKWAAVGSLLKNNRENPCPATQTSFHHHLHLTAWKGCAMPQLSVSGAADHREVIYQSTKSLDSKCLNHSIKIILLIKPSFHLSSVSLTHFVLYGKHARFICIADLQVVSRISLIILYVEHIVHNHFGNLAFRNSTTSKTPEGSVKKICCRVIGLSLFPSKSFTCPTKTRTPTLSNSSYIFIFTTEEKVVSDLQLNNGCSGNWRQGSTFQHSR